MRTGQDQFSQNEELPCCVDGCGLLRYGANHDCYDHATSRFARQRERAMRAVATRRERHPHRFLPNSGSPNYWGNVAHAAVAKAVALGILPNLSSGLYACVDCCGVASQYDHRDYGRPLDVQPVCRSCNCKRGSAKCPSASDYNFPMLATISTTQAA